MDKIIKRLQKDFNQSSDLIIKNINDIHIIFLESLCSSDRINDYILKILSLKQNKFKHLKDILAGPKTTKITNFNQIKFFLNNSFAIIIDKKDIYAIEVKANLARSISTPDTQPAIYGP